MGRSRTRPWVLALVAATAVGGAPAVEGGPKPKPLKAPRTADQARTAIGAWLDATLATARKRSDTVAVHVLEGVATRYGRDASGAAVESGPTDVGGWLTDAVGAAEPAAAFLAVQTPVVDVLDGQSVRQLAEAARALETWNRHRARAGIPALRLDPARCVGPILHARYLVRHRYESVRIRLGTPHEEAEADAYYTPEGRAAARACNLSTSTPDQSVERCMATLYHRLVLLDPAERTAAIGWWREGGEQVCCVGPGGDRDPAFAGSMVVRTPTPDEKDVRLGFAESGERPEPVPSRSSSELGYPITVTFYGGTPKISSASITLVAGKEAVEGFLSTPEAPSNPEADVRFLDATCAFLPARPLRPRTTHEVRARATVDGRPWDAVWTFTTGAPPRD